MSAVSGDGATGVEGAGPPALDSAALRGVAGCASQSLHDFDAADLLAVGDCGDVDAIVGWCVWRALQVDALIEAGISAAMHVLQLVNPAAFIELPDSLSTFNRLTAERAASSHGLEYR